MCRPRIPAGPSIRLLECPPNGCAIVMTGSPGFVRAAYTVMFPSMLATSRWSAYLHWKTSFKSSTHRASISSMYFVPANQRSVGPICPSAARVPTSDAKSLRTVGLVGASGASKFRHSSPLQTAFLSTACITSVCITRGEEQRSNTSRAHFSTLASWTSKACAGVWLAAIHNPSFP